MKTIIANERGCDHRVYFRYAHGFRSAINVQELLPEILCGYCIEFYYMLIKEAKTAEEFYLKLSNLLIHRILVSQIKLKEKVNNSWVVHSLEYVLFGLIREEMLPRAPSNLGYGPRMYSRIPTKDQIVIIGGLVQSNLPFDSYEFYKNCESNIKSKKFWKDIQEDILKNNQNLMVDSAALYDELLFDWEMSNH